MARPQIRIDWEAFDNLCAMHCTQIEIAGWFKCSVDTIDRAVKRHAKMSFAEYFAEKSAPGKISLRRKQFDMAQKGDRTMLIWLGKQYLGQAEKSEQHINHSGSMSHELSSMTLEQKASEIARLEKLHGK